MRKHFQIKILTLSLLMPLSLAYAVPTDSTAIRPSTDFTPAYTSFVLASGYAIARCTMLPETMTSWGSTPYGCNFKASSKRCPPGFNPFVIATLRALSSNGVLNVSTGSSDCWVVHTGLNLGSIKNVSTNPEDGYGFNVINAYAYVNGPGPDKKCAVAGGSYAYVLPIEINFTIYCSNSNQADPLQAPMRNPSGRYYNQACSPSCSSPPNVDVHADYDYP